MRLLVCFTALLLVFLVLSDQFQAGTALKKKKILKKLKDLLPLLLALKGKKKLLVLPIPIPIKVNKESKAIGWPALPPSWSAPPPSHQPISWPSAPIPESYLSEALASWPSSGPSSSVQSAPPASKSQVTHSYLSPQYLTDDSSLKKSIEKYLTTYVVKDGPGLSSLAGYGQSILSSNQNSLPGSYGRNRDLELRRPTISVPNKSAVKKPVYFGQPLSTADDYESGKGSAPIYNDAPRVADQQQQNNNRAQSVSVDYNGGGGQNYAADATLNNGNNDYKVKNEADYDDTKVRSVSGNYEAAGGGSQADSNEGSNYEENNELINENANADQGYEPNNVPAVRIPGYKKKAKV